MPDKRGAFVKGLKKIGLGFIVVLGLLSIIGSGNGFNNSDGGSGTTSSISSEKWALETPDCPYEYFDEIEENCLTYVELQQIKADTDYTVVTVIRNKAHNTKAQAYQFTDATGTVIGAGQGDIIWEAPEEDESVITGDINTTGMLGEYMVDTWLVEEDGDRSFLFSYEITVSTP